MELGAYLGVLSFGAIFASVNISISKRTFFCLWFFIYSLLVIVVRQHFDADIAIYARLMTFDGFPYYQFKEPLIWFSQKILYKIFGNSFTVFAICDLIIGLILFKTLYNLKVKKYVYFSILLFFPVILGMQNIYRQWVASVLFLYSISLIWNNTISRKSIFAFVISIFSHNSAVLMTSVYFSIIRGSARHFWLLSLLICILLMFYGAKLKSTATTGADLSLAYVILSVFMIIAICLLDAGKIKKLYLYQYKILMSVVVLSVSSLFLLSSASSERVSMSFLIILYPILSIIIEERFKRPILIRLLFLFSSFVPITIYPISQFII